jgi:hypothetical protein
MLVQAISVAEGAGHNGANLLCRITHADLTTATADTAEVETILSQNARGEAMVGGTNFSCVLKDFVLTEPFQDTADAAFNDLQVKVGDSSDDDQFLATTQINLNGTEAIGPSIIPDAITAAATSVTATFTPAGGKNNAALNKGILDLYFFVQDGRVG